MIGPLLLVTILGCVLAIVTEMSVALALNRPLRAQTLSPILLKAGHSQGKDTMLSARAVLSGFGMLLAAQLVVTYIPLVLGTFLVPVQTAILVVFVAWMAGLLAAVAQLPFALGFEALLSAGDPDFDYAVQVAKSSGIPLKTVAIVNTTVQTRQPRFAKTIVLSRSERVELSAQDLRVLIAERVGALRFIKPSLLATAQKGFFVLCGFLLIHALGNPWHITSVSTGLIAPFIIWTITPWPDRRMNRELDRFTLGTIGNLNTVDQAITNQFMLVARTSKLSKVQRRELSKLLARRRGSLQTAARDIDIHVRLLP